MHGNATNEITQRNKEKVTKPEIITEYNKYTNGVDKCDQYLNYYVIGRKSIKWWKKIFFHMFEMNIINAMVLYFTGNPELAKKRQSHKKFRVMLVHELVEPLLQKRNESTSGPGRQPLSASPRLKGKHCPISCHPKRGRCTVCSHEKSNPTGKEKGTKNF